MPRPHVRLVRRNVEIIRRVTCDREPPKQLARRFHVTVWAIYKIIARHFFASPTEK